MRGHRLVTVFTSLVLATELAAQESGTVYGTVTDSAGTGLSHAIVRAMRRGGDGRMIAAATTDSAGHYRLEALPAGWLAFEAGRIGYRPHRDSLQLAAGALVRLDVALAANAFLLAPMVVTAAKRSQLLDEVVTSVALVEQTQIAQHAINTIDEAVDRAPGVQFINGQVNIRGSSGFAEGLGSRVLLLVDGVPANQGDRGGINWDVIPVDRIDHVEVVKGSGSALYGSAAFGGVVNVITRDLSEGWHERARVTTGVFANPPQAAWQFRDFTGIQNGLDLAASYGRNPVRVGFSAGARHTDGYHQQSRADHWQMTGKADWRPDPATQVNVSGAWASDQYQVSEPWCSRIPGAFGTSPLCDDGGLLEQPFRIVTTNRGNDTRSDKGVLNAIVTRTPRASLTWLARLSWLRTRFTDDYPTRADSVGGPADYSIANRYGIEGRLVSQRDSSRTVTVGLEGAIAEVWSNIFSGNATGGTGTHTQGEYAAYAEAEQTVGPINVTIGARSDFLVVDGGGVSAFVSPRAGAVWPTRTGSWRASIGRAFRAASLAERFVTTTFSGLRVIPNPALTSENGWSGEIGRSWTGVPWLRGDAALFWTESRNLIEPQVNLLSQIQFQNLNRGRIMGLDLSATAAPVGPRLSTSLAYQYLYARQLATATTPTVPLLFRPRHLVTLSTDYTSGPLGLGADFRYSSRYERVDPLYPNDRVYTVHVLDMRASWTTGPLEVRLKLSNVFNQIYNLAPRTLEPVRALTLVATYTR